MRKPQGSRAVWIALASAMCVSAAWLLTAGRGTSLGGDELYYYAQYVAHGPSVEPGHGLEYLLAPHNGHFPLVGKAIYRLLFEIVGTDYFIFRVVEVVSVLLAVGLFFELARRRVGPLVALAPSVLLLFLGYAWELLLWPFDMHTVLALAFGLAALLALERGDRRGDWAACTLLVLSVATIEVGLAFAVGVAVSVVIAPDRWRRAWIFLVPLALYAIWWAWALQFDQTTISLVNVHLIPIGLADGLAAVLGSIFGLNPTGEGVAPEVTTVTTWGTALGALAVVALIIRIRQGAVPRTLWVFLAIVVIYWITIALGGRPPDASRYILVATVMVLLVAVDAVREAKPTLPGVVGLFCLVALAIPANVAKLYDGRRVHLNGAAASRTEFGMLELVRGTVDPHYLSGKDPRVAELGGSLSVPLPASDYFRAADDFGSLGYSLDEVRSQSLQFRQVADATLVGALRIELRPAAAPQQAQRCPTAIGNSPGAGIYFGSPPGRRMLLGPLVNRPIGMSISRFAKDGPGMVLGKIRPGTWSSLKLPTDSAGGRWRLQLDGGIRVCYRSS